MNQRCASDIPQVRRYEIGDVDIAGLGETLKVLAILGEIVGKDLMMNVSLLTLD